VGVQFSPDGNVVVGEDRERTGSLYFWRAPTWAEIAAEEAEHPPPLDTGTTGKTGNKRP
jgi:hypothetical protein